MKDALNPFEILTYILPGWLLFTVVMLVPPPVSFTTPALMDKEAVAALTWLLVAYVLGHICGLASSWLNSKFSHQTNYFMEIWDDPALKAVSLENLRAAFAVFVPYYPKLIDKLDKLNVNYGLATGLFNLVQEYNIQQGVQGSSESVYGEVKFLQNLSIAAQLVLVYLVILLIWRGFQFGLWQMFDPAFAFASAFAVALAVLLLTRIRIPQRSRLHVLLVYRAFLVSRLRQLETSHHGQ
jgi:hypothetical protein